MSQSSLSPDASLLVRDGRGRYLPASADQILSLGRLEECLVSDAPDDEYRRRVIAFHQPLFSSSLDFTR